MDRITMLGTGHAMTMDCFNTCFVYENEHGKMLVDTGGGQQLMRQLRDAGISSREISHVFISHQHTDHLLGLPWLFRTLGGPGGGQRLTLYMHEELMAVAEGVLNLLLPEQMARLGDQVRFVTVKTDDEAEILGRKVRFFDLISPTVRQYGFSMELDSGKRFVFHGDVPFHESNRARIQGADYLMHEAFHLDGERPGGPGGPGGPKGPGGPGAPGGPKNMGHSTVKQAAEYARSLGAGTLILVHGSDHHLERRQTAYMEEARREFGGEIYVPYDLDVIELK